MFEPTPVAPAVDVVSAYPGTAQPGVQMWQYVTKTLSMSDAADTATLSRILTLAGTGIVLLHTYRLIESPKGLQAFVVFATQAVLTKDDCRQRQAELLSQILSTSPNVPVKE